jgi:hypothetical protein
MRAYPIYSSSSGQSTLSKVCMECLHHDHVRGDSVKSLPSAKQKDILNQNLTMLIPGFWTFSLQNWRNKFLLLKLIGR